MNINNKYMKIINLLVFLNMINMILLDDSSSNNINRETLTRIIKYSLNDDIESNYATVVTTLKGNLICSSSYYEISTLKYYYGLKPNGRPLFTKNGEETEFCDTDSDKNRNEGNLYGIQLAGSSSDDKEYIIGISNNLGNVEIYDFTLSNPVVYSKFGQTFFSSNYNNFKYVSIFKLKNGDNLYLLALTLQHEGDYKRYFHVYKLQFPNIDPNANYIVTTYSKYIDLGVFYTSCFETNNNNIICFYIGQYKIYTLIAFDYDLIDPINTTPLGNKKYADTIFYKCIHFVDNVGVFLYFNTDGKICIIFKEFISNNFDDYFTSSELNPIQIDNNDYSDNVQKSDLVKIKDRKFCYLTIKKNEEELHIFIFNNFVGEQFIIRHYALKTFEKNNLKIGQELRLSLYNDFFALATQGYLNGFTVYSYLILFSYPNSTDFSIDITDTLKSSQNPIINFNDKCQIENNIFGYEIVGIQLLNFSEGLKLLNEDDKTIISKDSTFDKNVELILKEDIDLSSNLRIEFAMVVKDPPYSLFKDYSEIINENLCKDPTTNTCNEQTYYQQNNHIGRTSYCSIIINSEQISKTCDENCFLCEKDSQECLFCIEEYWKKSDDNKKCTNIRIPSTIIQESKPSTVIDLPISNIPIPNISTNINKSTMISIIPHSTSSNTIPNTIIRNPPSTIPSSKGTENNNLEDNNSDKNCTVYEILNHQCTNGKILINQLEEIKNNLLNPDYNGENTIIETETVIIQLAKLDDQINQENPNVSNIDLAECEDIFRSENHLDEDEDLIVYKTDIKTSDLSSTYVIYEIYDSSLNKLNLDVCKDSHITINVPVHFDDSLNNLAKSLSDSGYNLFNEEDSFYNDICSTYTNENGTDMILSDRKQDIYSTTQNQTICQKDCLLESYNVTSKKAKCNCNIVTKHTINSLNVDNLFNKKEIAKSFYDTLANSNFQVMKCFKLILDFSNFFMNYGQIVMTISVFIFIIMMIIYFILGNKKINQYLESIIKWNAKSDKNSKNHYDDESVVDTRDKKIHEKRKKKFKSKTTKKNKYKTNFAPPKKRKKIVEIKSENKYNHSKNITSNNDLKQIKNEGVGYKKQKNKKNKIRALKDDKIKFKFDNNIDTKKNMRETEDNNKIESLDTNIDYIKYNYTDAELDVMDYEQAIIYDHRTFLQYYWSVLKQNQLIIFTFFQVDDFNLIYAKIALFIISFGLFITINGFFFSDDTMHKVYEDNGKFDIFYQIPQIFYSSVISSIANFLLKILSLSENNILELKSETYSNMNKGIKKKREIERCLKIKLILFFIISLILMLFFWYFISCFCAVYKNTQIILLKDTGISLAASMVYPFILSFLPGFFRIPSLRAEKRNFNYLYKISLLVNWFI